MYKKLIIFTLLIILLNKNFAQNSSCITDELHQQRLKNDPDYFIKTQATKKIFNQLMNISRLQNKTRIKAYSNDTPQVAVIPIVIHVAHLGEEIGTGTNISNETIYNTIDEVNKIFRNKYKNSTDMLIQFQIAGIDTNGNKTIGINRINTIEKFPNKLPLYGVKFKEDVNCANAFGPLTVEDIASIYWPKNKYYNIYIVKKNSCAVWAGFSFYPTNSLNEFYDFTFVNYSDFNSKILSHELGHSLNLFHTFEGDEDGSVCPTNNNCDIDGDGCCDTPPHKRNDCDSSNCTFINLKNSTNNFMSYCYNKLSLFTYDQKLRSTNSIKLLSRQSLITNKKRLTVTLSVIGDIGGTISRDTFEVDSNSNTPIFFKADQFYKNDSFFINNIYTPISDTQTIYFLDTIKSNLNIKIKFKFLYRKSIFKPGEIASVVGGNFKKLQFVCIAESDTFEINNFTQKNANGIDTTYQFIVPNNVKNGVYFINFYNYSNQILDSFRLIRFFVIPNYIDSVGVVAWGNNSFGQTKVPIGLKNIIQISSGGFHSLALQANGKLVAWGDNSFGQLNLPAVLNNVVQVSTGRFHSLALNADGVVFTTFSDYYALPNLINYQKDIVQMDANSTITTLLKSNGEVIKVGYEDKDTFPKNAKINNIIQVAAGSFHALGLKKDLTTITWGDGGVSDNIQNNIKKINCGRYFNIGLRLDSSIVTWGNTYSIDSKGDSLSNNKFLKFIKIAGGHVGSAYTLKNVLGYVNGTYQDGGTNFLALTKEGKILGSGYNDNGELNIPNKLIKVIDISAGAYHSIAIHKLYINTESNFGGQISPTINLKNGDTYRITYNPNPYYFVDSVFVNDTLVKDSLNGYTFKNIYQYQTIRVKFGKYSKPDKPILNTKIVGSKKIILNYQTPKNKGSEFIKKYIVKILGNNIVDSTINNQIILNGLLDNVSYSLTLQAINSIDSISDTVYIPNITPLSLAEIISTNKVIYKEKDTFFILGNNLKKIDFISLPKRHTYTVTDFLQKKAINYDTLYSFIVPNNFKNDVYYIDGYNYQNLISDSFILVRFFIVPKNIDSLGVYAWGENEYGQTNIPDSVSKIIDVAAGYDHSIVLKSDGNLIAWGRNDYGQSDLPINLKNVVQVSTRTMHNLALKDDGTINVWGDDYYKNISDIPNNLKNVVQVSAGFYHSAVLLQNGSVIGWGNVGNGIRIKPDYSNFKRVLKIATGLFNLSALQKTVTNIAIKSVDINTPNIYLNNKVYDIKDSIFNICVVYGQPFILQKKGELLYQNYKYLNNMDIITDTIIKDSLIEITSNNKIVYVKVGNFSEQRSPLHILGLRNKGDLFAWGETSTNIDGSRKIFNFTIPKYIQNVTNIASGGDHAIVVHKLYIKTNVDSNGFITPTTFVKWGDNLRITYKGIKGYYTDSVLINDILVKDSLIGFTFRNISQFKNIHVKFKQVNKPSKPQNVIGIGGKNKVSIYYTSPVDNGGAPITKYIIQVLNTNFKDSQLNYPISINNLQNNQPYTISLKAVNAAELESDTVLIQVTPINQFLINTNVMNGYISPSKIIDTTKNYRITYSPLANYIYLDSIYINDVYNNIVTRDSINSYTFDSVKSNQTIKVIFKLQTTCPTNKTPIITRVNNNLTTDLPSLSQAPINYHKQVWYESGNQLTATLNNMFSPINIGIYTVKGFDTANNCATNLSKKYYYSKTCITPTGRLGNGANIQANIVGNANLIIIKWCTDLIKENITIQVLDISGAQVYEQEVPYNLGTMILNKSKITSKNYYIQVLDSKGEIMQISDLIKN